MGGGRGEGVSFSVPKAAVKTQLSGCYNVPYNVHANVPYKM